LELFKMKMTLRYKCREGDQWVERHRLIQTEQAEDGTRTGSESEWTVEHTVLEVTDGKCRVAWKRRGGEAASLGEVWVDSLGRSSTDGEEWSPALFPEKALQVGDEWTQEPSALQAPVYFMLESADDKTACLKSECEVEGDQERREIRASFTMCRQTGRALRSTTATLSQADDGPIIETVLEVNVDE
jgi:hypothetical protein